MNQYSDLLSELSDFLYPRSPYYGQLEPEYARLGDNPGITFIARLPNFILYDQAA